MMKPEYYSQKWEYAVVSIDNRGKLIDGTERNLNDVGNDGWELVSIAFDNKAFFKRPIRRVDLQQFAATLLKGTE